MNANKFWYGVDKLDRHLKNTQQSYFLAMFVGFLDLWMMPLLFLLSGLGSWYSLKSRGRRRYPLDFRLCFLRPSSIKISAHLFGKNRTAQV